MVKSSRLDMSWYGSMTTAVDPRGNATRFYIRLFDLGQPVQALPDQYSQYQKHMHYNVTHLRRQAFYALPQEHWQLLAAPPISYLDTLNAVDDAIDANARIASGILSTALSSLNLPRDPPMSIISDQKHPLDWRGSATPNDIDKAQTIIRQLYRDWSAEGAAERSSCNDPVLQDLEKEFPASDIDRNNIKVLIPGAGLGRLVFDVCSAGFQAEGNEISFHALFTSSYILNHLPAGHQLDLYPWISTFSNRVSRKDQLRRVKIPDVHPGTELDRASQGQNVHAFQRMSMTASDFTLLYADEGQKGMFDAVCTIFFIDTAPNVLRYVETIRNCLKPGGLWINVGPLLWHFHPHVDDRGDCNSGKEGEDVVDRDSGDKAGNIDQRRDDAKGYRRDRGIAEPGSVELTNEEVLNLIEKSGFRIEKQEMLDGGERGGGYISDETSMFVQWYRLSHWVARRNRE